MDNIYSRWLNTRSWEQFENIELVAQAHCQVELCMKTFHSIQYSEWDCKSCGSRYSWSVERNTMCADPVASAVFHTYIQLIVAKANKPHPHPARPSTNHPHTHMIQLRGEEMKHSTNAYRYYL